MNGSIIVLKGRKKSAKFAGKKLLHKGLSKLSVIIDDNRLHREKGKKMVINIHRLNANVTMK